MLTRIGEIRRAGQQAKFYNYNLLKAFEKGAQWADEHPENKWRSVKDELPETNDDVLADVLVAFGDKIYHEYELAYFNQDKRQWLTLDGEPIKVAHWQPLPELPKIDK
jgi:hypothetical protein